MTPLVAAAPSVPITPASPSASDSVKAAQTLATSLRYGMDTWWPGPAQTMLGVTLNQSIVHDEVRRLSSVALGVSTALGTGVALSVSAPTATARMVQLIDRVATQHLVNTPGGWGETWQGSLWASACAQAAWFSWGSIPTGTRTAVIRMVEREANYVMKTPIHYYRNAAGTILTAGDSGAEEVAWQGGVLQVALVMLPDHQNVPAWLAQMKLFALAAWARPSDVGAYPGVTGSNIEMDGTLINHNRTAPDYSTCTQFNLWAYTLFTLAGKPTPQAVRQLLIPVYAALNGLYVPGTATITYPQPCDWGNGQMLPYALSDAHAYLYGYDSGTAGAYMIRHLDAQIAMQARHADGHTYANATEYNYEGGEEQIMQLAAQLWWALYLRDRGLGSFA